MMRSPRPLPVLHWYEIGCKAILMRALPWPRFCGLAYGQQVLLPFRAAVALEEFEQGLRLAGLMAGNQHVRQFGKLEDSFRVETCKADVSRMNISKGHSYWFLDNGREVPLKLDGTVRPRPDGDHSPERGAVVKVFRAERTLTTEGGSAPTSQA